MRTKVWKNRNKQDVHSGYAAWDDAVRSLITGNVMDPGYAGFYIRPRQTPFYPDDKTPAKLGQMRDFDLRGFGGSIPRDVLAAVESVTETEYAILYQLFHYNGDTKIEHGWILTGPVVTPDGNRDDPRNYRLLGKFYTGRIARSRLVVDTAAEYLSNP